MAKQSRTQKHKVEQVMHEYKEGELKSGGNGKKVKSRRQAIAIALSEAGASKNKTPRANWRNRKKLD